MPDPLSGMLTDMVAEVLRELWERERRYPQMLAAGELCLAGIEQRTARMYCVLELLRALQREQEGDGG